MRRAAFVLVGLLATAALAVLLLIGYLVLFRPLIRPLTDRKFFSTPQRLERGRYLVDNLTACIRCHSPNELRKPIAGTEGSGWVLPAPPNNPAKHNIVASNITPDKETGIGLWTDDEFGRAIREGVSRSGRSFTYAMPCSEYRKMSDEDLASVVVYIRSLAPIRSALPTTNLVFPVMFLVRLVPVPLTSPVTADLSTAEKRGRYLVSLGTCSGCHSPHDFAGHLIEHLAFSGGDVLPVGSPPATGTNITPDDTGLKQVTLESFRQIMRTGQKDERPLHPLMPYEQYAGLTDSDLNDMYVYLRSVKPVRHVVAPAGAPTLCRVCKNKHGGGNLN